MKGEGGRSNRTGGRKGQREKAGREKGEGTS